MILSPNQFQQLKLQIMRRMAALADQVRNQDIQPGDKVAITYEFTLNTEGNGNLSFDEAPIKVIIP